MNYTEFVQKYARQLKESPLRDGQQLFTTLLLERPDLAEQIRGTEHDPFYDDNKITACWAYLAVRW